MAKAPKSLRIKDEETCQMIRQLAALTGETYTEAVRVALKEALERSESEATAPQGRETSISRTRDPTKPST
jgi:hypothetical protein